ncbi:MAG TPA: hypothetical protein DEQ20_00165 [Desulfobulbaceae bacterium]|nr:MAG: hypothetical protein A2520_11275 [Deltaproteobacteria bacterium RIFOXYD12_FULL_53_23]HCC53339.1 hypothetical protein [Desulfobulbaceae bacterium]
MEIHDPNLHLKLMEMCDCYLGTDYAATIQQVADTPSKDLQEDAFRYLALAILLTLTEKALQLALKRKHDKITVTIKHDAEKIALRPPTRPVFDKIIAIMRGILHLDEDKGSLQLTLGLKNDQIEVQVKIERTPDKETLKIKFPDLT